MKKTMSVKEALKVKWRENKQYKSKQKSRKMKGRR